MAKAKKKTTGENAADAFLRSKGVNPADFVIPTKDDAVKARKLANDFASGKITEAQFLEEFKKIDPGNFLVGIKEDALKKAGFAAASPSLPTASVPSEMLSKDQLDKIAREASVGNPEARKLADDLVLKGQLQMTRTPTGTAFSVPSESKTAPLEGSMKPVGAKPVTAGEQVENQLALERNIAKKKAAQPAPEPIEKVARPEQAAQKQKLVQAAKEEKARQASAEAAAELEKPAPAAKIEGGELRQTGSEADRLAALKKRNFKAEWGKLPKAAKEKILVDAFGQRALALNEATKQKLGEIAVAKEAFKQSALTSIPDMDDTLKSLGDLENRLQKATETTDFRALKTQMKDIEQAVNVKHQRLLTGQSGKIRGNLLTFRKPRAGEVGSAKIGETEVARPKPESGVEERSPGFDKAKVAEVPVDAKNAKGKLSVDDVGVPAAAAPEALAEAAAATAVEAVAADKAMAERSAKYKAAIAADPKKYGVGEGLTAWRSWTPEQSAARKELRKQLGYPDKFVPRSRGAAAPGTPAPAAPAAPAAAKPGRVQMTEAEKKAWGNAVRADKTKYGTSAKKATEAQKAARNELAAKIVAGRRGGTAAPAADAAATAAVAATAPATPPTSGGAPAAPATTPTKGGPLALRTAPAAPAAATPPAAAAGAGTAAAASKLPNPYGAGSGKWKPNPARNVDALKKRAAKMGIGKGIGSKAAGALSWLGPLAAIYGAYQVVDMLKQGTIDASDERRLKAMQALGAVSGGMGADLEAKAQVAQMQRMVDLAAIQRQKTRDEMQNRFVQDQALNSLLAGHQASLAALAQPSRPSIAEMMARM